jgi:transposase
MIRSAHNRTMKRRPAVSDGISEKQFVGVDLHLHRSVVCRINGRGQQLDCAQIDNDPKALVKAVRSAGRGAPVAVEATYGWYWAVDALQAARFEVHLAHPYGMKAMRKRKRVKTDAKDAYELANLLRLGSLPEGYIAPKELRGAARAGSASPAAGEDRDVDQVGDPGAAGQVRRAAAGQLLGVSVRCAAAGPGRAA